MNYLFGISITALAVTSVAICVTMGLSLVIDDRRHPSVCRMFMAIAVVEVALWAASGIGVAAAGAIWAFRFAES